MLKRIVCAFFWELAVFLSRKMRVTNPSLLLNFQVEGWLSMTSCMPVNLMIARYLSCGRERLSGVTTIPRVRERSVMPLCFRTGMCLYASIGVTEITPEKTVVWNYDAPPGHEIHTAIPIGKERVLYIQNGDPAMIGVVSIATNATEKEITLTVKRPSSTHGQFRHHG
jgi:hypothetical protein